MGWFLFVNKWWLVLFRRVFWNSEFIYGVWLLLKWYFIKCCNWKNYGWCFVREKVELFIFYIILVNKSNGGSLLNLIINGKIVIFGDEIEMVEYLL